MVVSQNWKFRNRWTSVTSESKCSSFSTSPSSLPTLTPEDYLFCSRKLVSFASFSSVQSLSHVRLCDPMDCMQHPRPPCKSPTPGVYSNSGPLSQWCHPIISSSLAPFSSCLNLSQHQDLYESALAIRWPKYWRFSFSPSNEHPGLISFRMEWLDLLAVQGTLKSLLQHHSSKASILYYLWSNSHMHTWLLEEP